MVSLALRNERGLPAMRQTVLVEPSLEEAGAKNNRQFSRLANLHRQKIRAMQTFAPRFVSP